MWYFDYKLQRLLTLELNDFMNYKLIANVNKL